MPLEIAEWPDGQPIGPRLNYPYAFDSYAITPAARRAIADKQKACERVIERLIAPDVQLQENDELRLTEAYYHAFFASYTNAETSLPYPPISAGKWVAPIRVTYQSIADGAIQWSKVLSIPQVSNMEEAIKEARSRGHWEGVHAASSQLGVLAVDVMLAGPLSSETHPSWCGVWLQPPDKVAEHTAGMSAMKQILARKGYTF